MEIHISLDNKTTPGIKSMKKFIVNEKSKQVMIENNVPEKLHNIVIGIIILITTDIERKYDKAKAIVETESINLSDNEIVDSVRAFLMNTIEKENPMVEEELDIVRNIIQVFLRILGVNIETRDVELKVLNIYGSNILSFKKFKSSKKDLKDKELKSSVDDVRKSMSSKSKEFNKIDKDVVKISKGNLTIDFTEENLESPQIND